MNPSLPKHHPSRLQGIPDPLVAWTSAAALVFFGLIFFDDAVIMGPTILTLGLLMAGNEALKLHAASAGAKHGHQKLRLILALAFVALVLCGFFFSASRQ
jgi:hypothetical protein